MEHKLPWTTSKQPGGRFWVIYSVDGSVIATGLYKWRAQQIVKACNEHAELKARDNIMVEILAEIKAKVEGNPEQTLSVGELVEACIDELTVIAKAALTKGK